MLDGCYATKRHGGRKAYVLTGEVTDLKGYLLTVVQLYVNKPQPMARNIARRATTIRL